MGNFWLPELENVSSGPSASRWVPVVSVSNDIFFTNHVLVRFSETLFSPDEHDGFPDQVSREILYKLQVNIVLYAKSCFTLSSNDF